MISINGVEKKFKNLEYSSEVDFTIKVKAVAKTGYVDSDWSKEITYTAPIALSAPVVTLNGNKATWTAVNGAVKYLVNVNGSTTETNALDYSVSDDAKIKVKALGDGEKYSDSDWSNVVVYTAPRTLSAPVVTLNGNVASWTAVASAVGYTIEVNEIEYDNGTALTYSADETYTLRVKALGDGVHYLDSVWSDSVTYTHTEPDPSKLSAPVVTLDGNKATWNEVENAISYSLEINGEVFDELPLLDWDDTDDYTLRVKALGDGERYLDSDWSNEVSYVSPKPLSTPVVTLNGNVASWTAIEHAVGYKIKVNGVESETSELSYSYDDDYTIQVMALGDGENHLDSDWSKVVKYVVRSVKLATPVVSLNGNVASWNAVAHAVSYEIEINGENLGTDDCLSLNLADGESIRVKALGDGTRYLDSDWSDSVKYNASKLPAPVITLNGNVASWTAVEHAKTYEIVIDGVNMGVDNVLSVALYNGNSIKVRAIGDGVKYADSGWSNEIKYYAPKLSAPVITLDGNVAKWNAVENAKTYEIEINGESLGSDDCLSLTLANGETIRVRAIGDNELYADSDWSNEVTFTVVPVQLDAPVITLNGNVASWTTVENAVSYELVVSGFSLGNDNILSWDLEDGETIKVKAIGDGVYYLDSDWSNEVTYVAAVQLTVPTITLKSNVASWTAIENAVSYIISVNGVESETTELKYSDRNDFVIKVKAIGDGVRYLDSDWSEELIYTAIRFAHAGTEEDPFTVEDIQKIFATLSKGEIYSLDGVKQKVYVAGYVTTVGTVSNNGKYQSKFYIADALDAAKSDSLFVYSANFTTSVTEIALDDYVVVHGYVIDYNGTKEIGQSGSDYPKFVSKVSPEKADAELVADELEKVTGIPFKIEANTQITLPVPSSDKVSFEWVSDNAQIVIENGKAIVTVTTTEVVVKLTLTAKCGEATGSKEFSLTLLKTVVEPAVEPVVGKAYYLVMNQEKANATVYLIDGMSGYYMATSEDVSKAIKIYVEETDGGLYMYTSSDNGVTKKYINAVTSGTYVNGAYGDTASTVWVWDATLETVKTTVNGKEYVLGTRNDKTYTTVGPVEVSKNPFMVKFEDTGDAPIEPVEKTDAELVADEIAKISGIPTTVETSTEITLPVPSNEKVTFEWVSNNAQIVIENGKAIITVTSTEIVVKLTLTVKCGEATDTVEYDITLVCEPELTDAEKVEYELDGLNIEERKYTSDTTVDLPTVGKYTDVTLTWSSDNAAVKVENGKLVIVVTETQISVTITLVATLNDVNRSKTFTLTLKKETSSETKSWQLLTDVNDLVEGSQVIIISSDGTKAMSTTQNKNNRGVVAISEGWTENLAGTIQILTISKGKIDGTFALGVTDTSGSVTGYLYAASGSKNYLKTEKTLSENSSFSIEITSFAVATIKALGSNKRNWLRYNSSSDLFSCYASGQADISLYILK